jgi:hypothetical protein
MERTKSVMTEKTVSAHWFNRISQHRAPSAGFHALNQMTLQAMVNKLQTTLKMVSGGLNLAFLFVMHCSLWPAAVNGTLMQATQKMIRTMGILKITKVSSNFLTSYRLTV